MTTLLSPSIYTMFCRPFGLKSLMQLALRIALRGPRVGLAGQYLLPLIPSITHLLLYILLSFTFPFIIRFIYFLAFLSLPILSE